jgi:hypothetical protein
MNHNLVFIGNDENEGITTMKFICSNTGCFKFANLELSSFNPMVVNECIRKGKSLIEEKYPVCG